MLISPRRTDTKTFGIFPCPCWARRQQLCLNGFSSCPASGLGVLSSDQLRACVLGYLWVLLAQELKDPRSHWHCSLNYRCGCSYASRREHLPVCHVSEHSKTSRIVLGFFLKNCPLLSYGLACWRWWRLGRKATLFVIAVLAEALLYRLLNNPQEIVEICLCLALIKVQLYHCWSVEVHGLICMKLIRSPSKLDTTDLGCATKRFCTILCIQTW